MTTRTESATPANPGPGASPRGWGALALVGPGIVLAATGVGAGDLVAAAVSGSRYGYAVAWAALAGALLKFMLNEGLARWQLATGTTLLEGWVLHLGRWVQYVFLAYLVVWSFVVGGALISACGLAAHALAPALSVKAWGALHSIVAALLVTYGGYTTFERLIKLFIALMFVTLVGCAVFIEPPHQTLSTVVSRAALPAGSTPFVLAVIGGVGGSVTLLSYGYWIREKRWEGPGWMRMVRIDLGVAYGLTGLFGLAVMVLAAAVLHGEGTEIQGTGGVLQMATMLERMLGGVGEWTFLVGFWGAVATSMLGVWQGVPYMFCDFVGLMKRLDADGQREFVSARSAWYRLFLAYLSLPTMLLLAFDKPVTVIVAYSVLGALFMPFLAATLLYMNSRSAWVGETLRNRPLQWLGLVVCLLLFGFLGVSELLDKLGGTG
jgi:Mn2+/Fe2+ NRAMP family transporter